MSPVPLLAHGLGDAADLPVPFGIVLWVVGALVLGAAAMVRNGRNLEAPQLPSIARGIRLPRLLARLVDAPATARLFQAALLLVLATVLALGLAGPDRAAVNPVPRLAYVVFWAGLVPLSLLFGAVWRAVNPLRLVADGLARLAGDPDEQAVRPVPERVGVWPAAVLLAVFTWGDLALGEQPRLTSLVLLAVLLPTLAGLGRHGRAWLEHGDPFEVYARVLGSVSVVARDSDGHLVLRSPRHRLATMASPTGLAAVVAVLVGGDLFDGLLGWLTWQNLKVGVPVPGRVLLDTAGLGAAVLGVGLVVLALHRHARHLLPALLPVVVAYAVAHYLPVLLMDLQVGLAQASDPLGRGWDLFGTAGWSATYDRLPEWLLAVVLLVVLVAGHVAAVVVAGDRARAAYGTARAAGMQLPLQAVLVTSALGSVAVRFSGG